jgi:hypothetical protein
MDETRHIYILLTKHSDNFSLLILALIRGYYSHASIGFDEEMGRYYSFTRRGFRVEEPHKICLKRKNVECVLYRVPVSQQAYDSMRQRLAFYHESGSDWKFNILGVFFGIARVPFLQRKHKRFCSQFVAEILEYGKEKRLQKRSSVAFPDDFVKAALSKPAFLGTLEGLAESAF